MVGLIKFANKTANIKYKNLTSLQHRVRATKSHIQNSTNHFSGIMWQNDLIALTIHSTWPPWSCCFT